MTGPSFRQDDSNTEDQGRELLSLISDYRLAAQQIRNDLSGVARQEALERLMSAAAAEGDASSWTTAAVSAAGDIPTNALFAEVDALLNWDLNLSAIELAGFRLRCIDPARAETEYLIPALLARLAGPPR